MGEDRLPKQVDMVSCSKRDEKSQIKATWMDGVRGMSEEMGLTEEGGLEIYRKLVTELK